MNKREEAERLLSCVTYEPVVDSFNCRGYESYCGAHARMERDLVGGWVDKHFMKCILDNSLFQIENNGELGALAAAKTLKKTLDQLKGEV